MWGGGGPCAVAQDLSAAAAVGGRPHHFAAVVGATAAQVREAERLAPRRGAADPAPPPPEGTAGCAGSSVECDNFGMQIDRDLDGIVTAAIQATADVQRAFVLAVVEAIQDETSVAVGSNVLKKVGESLHNLKSPEVPAASSKVPAGLPRTYQKWFEHERLRLIEAITMQVPKPVAERPDPARLSKRRIDPSSLDEPLPLD